MEIEVGLCALIDLLLFHLSPEGISIFLTSLQGPIRTAMVVEKCTEHTSCDKHSASTTCMRSRALARFLAGWDENGNSLSLSVLSAPHFQLRRREEFRKEWPWEVIQGSLSHVPGSQLMEGRS